MTLTYGSIQLQVANEQSITDLMKNKQYKMCGVFVQEQFQSLKDSRCLEEDRLYDEKDKLWKLMQFHKRRHKRVRQTIQCEIGSKVENYEGKYIGVLQYKVWKPRRKKIRTTRDIIQQHGATNNWIPFKFWDPGRRLMTRSS